jgi:hypothetical protein
MFFQPAHSSQGSTESRPPEDWNLAPLGDALLVAA